jgi:NADPH:quinone reductase-like Zn-dependent oxidoreductase
MKAAVYERYGSPEVVEIKEIDKPNPKDDEVLIKTHAATVTSADWRVRSLTVPTGFGLIIRLVFGISKPRQPILGSELAGVVESVGKFKPGDAVFAFSDAAMGCHAAYKCVLQNSAIAFKPRTLSFEEAAALSFGGTTALHFLRKSKLQRGDKILIVGASGSVGTAAVQLARYFGAEVTGVCSAVNSDLVQSLGASHVIDYTQEDFTLNAETYDVILDTTGSTSFARCKTALKENGRFLMLVASLPQMLQIPLVNLTSNKKIIAGTASGTAEDLRFLADLAQTGQFMPVIDTQYPFEHIVDAHRHVDSGRKKGNIILLMALGH